MGAENNLVTRNTPNIFVKEIPEVYTQRNFQALTDYFQAQNQFLDYKFFEVIFTKAQTDVRVAHGLGYTADDVVVTAIVGAGAVTFNRSAFDNQNIVMSSTGAATIRFYCGRYWAAKALDRANLTNQVVYADPVSSAVTQAVAAATTAANTAIAAAILNSGVPTGVIFPWTTAVAPAGYLLCSATAVSRTTYAALFAVIGTTYGVGDGSTTFNLPDPTGLALTWAGGQTISAVAYARTLGTKQGDTVQDHIHNYTVNSNGPVNFSSGSATTTPDTNLSARSTTGMASGRAGTETRMANMAFTAIIKT